jgi:hypothetical protein
MGVSVVLRISAVSRVGACTKWAWGSGAMPIASIRCSKLKGRLRTPGASRISRSALMSPLRAIFTSAAARHCEHEDRLGSLKCKQTSSGALADNWARIDRLSKRCSSFVLPLGLPETPGLNAIGLGFSLENAVGEITFFRGFFFVGSTVIESLRSMYQTKEWRKTLISSGEGRSCRMVGQFQDRR